jgi:hypothetical protein
VIALAIAASVPLSAHVRQDQAIDSVFRSGVEVVRGRNIQNGRGRAPRRLTREDFEIKQNGVLQPIDVFEVFALTPTRFCYEIGFSSTIPAAVKKRTVEIKVRGYSKKIKSTYTLDEDGQRPDAKSRGGACK